MTFWFLFNCLLAIVSLIYFFLHRKFKYWKHQNVPHIQPEMFYGNSRGISKDYNMSTFFRRMYTALKHEGPIGGIYIFTQAIALVTDLDLVKNILVKDFNNFPNRGLYSNEEDDPLSAHLVNIEDDAWRNLRHKVTPTFTSGKLKMLFGTVQEIAEKLVATILKESAATGQLEVKDVMSRFTTDVIASIAFGIDCDSLGDKSTEFYRMGLKSFSSFNIFKRAFLLSYGKLGRKLHMTTTNEEVGDFYLDVVKKAIKFREDNPEIQRNDFLNLLTKLKGDEELTFNQIAAQSFVFLLAGFETTASTLTFCLYELSHNKEIQEKARESILQTLQKHENCLTYDAINEMDYLEKCINETLRKYPPIVNLQRTAKKDYRVPNTRIVLEKGTTVIIPITAYHWDPEIYPNPDKFDPERFTPDEVKKRHPYAFMPFGEGPRICIGMRFAIVEIKIALALILTNYKFDLDRNKTSVPLKFEPNRLFLTPAEGIVVNFEADLKT